MATAEKALSVSGLRAVQAGAEVVSDFGLEVCHGEVVALLGPNGAGKSTVVDALCGFVEKRGGSVLLDGKDITGLPPFRIARMGLVQVSQARDLFPDMSVEENLIAGSEAVGGRRSMTMDKLYEIFPRLYERLKQRAGSLSGGEQQMLAIARALVGAPKVLLLDEPSTGLAPVVVDQIVAMLHRLAGEGLTLVLVEQNVGVALDLCERFVVLKGGSVVFAGGKAELGASPREFLAQLYL